MAAEQTLYEHIFDYFDGELAAVRTRLESGELDSFKERVITCQKITEALSLLSPYVRSESRARYLVKCGEELREELLSVRGIIRKRYHLRRKRQAALMAQVMKKRDRLR